MRAKLETWSKSFSQEADTCSSEETQALIIEQDDGGGGAFWRLRTQEWAINDIEEFVALLKEAGVAERSETVKAA